jgi:hypothetical protein
MLKEEPFLGHSGIGARICLNLLGQKMILIQTKKSQLMVIFLLGFFTIFPLWFLLFEPEKLHNGWVGKIVSCLSIIASAPFLVKFLLIFFGKRRIEFDLLKKKISFITERKKVTASIEISEVDKIDIFKSFYQSDAQTIENYSLVLYDKNSKTYRMCTSDSKENIEDLHQQIQEILTLSQAKQ